MTAYKKIIIGFLSYMISILSYTNIQAQNYISYHQNIKTAEKAILDSNYTKAIEIYDSIFNVYEFCFAKHCFTATQTSIKVQDYERAYHFIQKGVKQGLKIEHFENDSIIKKIKNSHFWDSIINQYDTLYTNYQNNIDSEYRLIINELYNKDQFWRDKHEIESNNFISRYFTLKKWEKNIQNIIDDKLFPLIIEKGFPGEKIIGIDEKYMHHKKTRDSFGSFFAFTMLIHYYNIPRKKHINEILKSEIDKGNLTPEQYASIIDFQVKWGKNKNEMYYNQWHSTKDSTQYKLINSNRQLIGLEPFELLNKKFERSLKICKLINEGIFEHIWLFSSKCDG